MYARIESVRSAGPRLDPRLVGGGLAAALAVGVIAGYLVASLSVRTPSADVSRAQGATVSAPSTGVYGDRDSRLPSAVVSAPATGVYGDRDSRLPSSAVVSSPSTGVFGDRDSRLPVASSLSGSEISALDRAIAARVSALQGLARVDWSGAAGDVYGLRDSRPPLAPFNLR